MSANKDPAAEAEDKPVDEKIPAQRRVFASKRFATPSPAEGAPELQEKLASLVDSVKVLQSHIDGGKPAGMIAADQEPKQRRMKRFQRSGGEDLPEQEGEATVEHEVRGDEATLNKNIAWPRLARTEVAPVYGRGRGTGSARQHPAVIYVLAQAAGLGLLLLGVWGGMSISGDEQKNPAQAGNPRSANNAGADLLARVGVSDRALDAANQGLQAEKSGKEEAARQIWESAVAGQVRLPGADYRLAMLEIQRGDLAAADIHLSNSLAAGEMMASCYFINACFAGKKSNYVEAAKQISNAVRVEPFSAKYLFCWGEALRRAGRAQAGVAALTQALDRPMSPSDTELYTFKLRLAKLQVGHDDALEAEITDRLTKNPAAGDWQLLAAARDLGRSAFPAAAEHLRNAARVLTPDVFNLLVQDFAYQGYATHAEVAALLKVPLPPSSTVPFDPGAWPAEEADPAVWPPFSPAL